MPFRFDNQYARFPDRFHARVAPTPVAAPGWLAVNVELGAELGLSESELSSPELLEVFAGNRIPEGAKPIALAYGGHQFGNWVPRLGDGRAILLGQALGADGARWDVQLKGSGPTPFSRGGDGRAALGPVLREFVVSEAMYALGVPTTRSLAAVSTGEPVYREGVLPGAIVTRVASSHVRVGTFQYFAELGDRDALQELVEYSLARHFPGRTASPATAPDAPPSDAPAPALGLPTLQAPALELLSAVIESQAALVAKWLAVGFVHGVMNTDNCAISGETLDYGPCAFLDTYHPGRVFSSIDRQGRYAFGHQPRIALWNVARLAEALLPLFGREETESVALAEASLGRFSSQFEAAYGAQMRAKLGLAEAHEGDAGLVQELLDLLAADRVDYTLAFRRLAEAPSGAEEPLRLLFGSQERLARWLADWRRRLAIEPLSPTEREARMKRANPAFIPRNHRVEEAIAAASQGDLKPFERLRQVLARPYEDQPEHAELAEPPGEDQWRYKTFCGT